MTSVLKATKPANRTSEPNSPIARANASAEPARIAGSRLGRMMRRKVVNGPAPSDARRLLRLDVDLHQHRLDGADDERQGDEQRAP